MKFFNFFKKIKTPNIDLEKIKEENRLLLEEIKQLKKLVYDIEMYYTSKKK